MKSEKKFKFIQQFLDKQIFAFYMYCAGHKQKLPLQMKLKIGLFGMLFPWSVLCALFCMPLSLCFLVQWIVGFLGTCWVSFFFFCSSQDDAFYIYLISSLLLIRDVADEVVLSLWCAVALIICLPWRWCTGTAVILLVCFLPLCLIGHSWTQLYLWCKIWPVLHDICMWDDSGVTL